MLKYIRKSSSRYFQKKPINYGKHFNSMNKMSASHISTTSRKDHIESTDRPVTSPHQCANCNSPSMTFEGWWEDKRPIFKGEDCCKSKQEKFKPAHMCKSCRNYVILRNKRNDKKSNQCTRCFSYQKHPEFYGEVTVTSRREVTTCSSRSKVNCHVVCKNYNKIFCYNCHQKVC